MAKLSAYTVFSPDDGKHGAEVLAFTAVQGNFDEVLYSLHSFELIGLPCHLSGHPEGLVVDGLLKTLQAGRAWLWSQLEQIVDVLSWLDGAEQFESSHWELRGNLHRTELQQRNLAFSQEILSILVWT